jgi:hypothetical protein
MIIPLIILGLIIIIWIQYPDIKENENEQLYKKIFNRIKVPLLFICSISIIYLLVCNKQLDNLSNINNQKVYMSYPNL